MFTLTQDHDTASRPIIKISIAMKGSSKQVTKSARIAIGAIFTECNHFGGLPIEIDWFERYTLARGAEMLELNSGVAGGMLETILARNAAPVPLLLASTCPGGPLTAGCYRQLKLELLDRLRNALPVDGILLPLHGAMTVEDVGDPEGDLIRSVREIVGWKIPIVATLDLHAHITAEMVDQSDAIVAWETYPHMDAFRTGQRGADLLLDVIAGKYRPTMVMAKVPCITSAINASTEGEGPFAQLMRLAKTHEAQHGVISTSLFLCHPYLDLPGMGSGALVITDNDPRGAQTIANELAYFYWGSRSDLEPQTYSVESAVKLGLQSVGSPVILVETADCCGGGAAGDSVWALRGLIEFAANQPAIVPVVDAAAANAAHHAGVGQTLDTSLGHKHDPGWGMPLDVRCRVAGLGDGAFRYDGGIWDGVQGNMGKCAVLEIGEIRVLVSTHGTYDWKHEQFAAMRLDPAKAKFIVAKNPMNYRQAYAKLSPTTYVLDTPGPTPATLRHVEFHKLQRPYFPADQYIPNLKPSILLSRRASRAAAPP